MSSRQQARSVKAGSSAEDARAQRMRNTVELRKQKTDDKMKRLRNIDTPGGDTLGGGQDTSSVINDLLLFRFFFLQNVSSFFFPFFVLLTPSCLHLRCDLCQLFANKISIIFSVIGIGKNHTTWLDD